jgi:hypothetical protein
MKTIACIGSRETAPAILSWMIDTGAALVRAGYAIKTGNAPGADQAWAIGANEVNPVMVTLCLPWAAFEPAAIHPGNVIQVYTPAQHSRYAQAALAAHPKPQLLSDTAIKLHARNAMIVEDVHMVLGTLGTKHGGGGSGNAFRIAQRNKIGTFNVSDAFVREAIEKRLAAGEDVLGPVFDTGKGRRW